MKINFNLKYDPGNHIIKDRFCTLLKEITAICNSIGNNTDSNH